MTDRGQVNLIETDKVSVMLIVHCGFGFGLDTALSSVKLNKKYVTILIYWHIFNERSECNALSIMQYFIGLGSILHSSQFAIRPGAKGKKAEFKKYLLMNKV